jgi:CelD/BcsL family acetyltransferase involved in cellulose biosynthesis
MSNEGASASHLDVIASHSNRDRVARLFAEYLEGCDGRWDILDFRHLAPDSAFGRHIGAISGRHRDEPESIAPYVLLPTDWESYRQNLSKKVRRNLDYSARLLDSQTLEQPSFRLISDLAEVEAVLDTMIDMHLNRIRRSTLGNPTFARFHHDFARRALAAGWLRLYTLEIRESRVAVIYCLNYGGRVSAYLSGFDSKWARYSPGRQIASHAIHCAIDEGASEFDWLQGESRFKREWTPASRSDRHRQVGRTWKGTIWILSRTLRQESLQLVRTAVPPGLRRELLPLYHRFKSLRRAIPS